MSAKRKSFISYMLICQLGEILGLAWQFDLVTATPLSVVAGGYVLGMVFAVFLYPVFITLADVLAENVRQHELNATGYDIGEYDPVTGEFAETIFEHHGVSVVIHPVTTTHQKRMITIDRKTIPFSGSRPMAIKYAKSLIDGEPS